MTSISGQVLRFEGYEIDPDRGELRCAGKVVPVEPQVFDLLLFLARNPGRLLSRDEIIDAVWDGRIISDSAISTRINAARQALGDDGKSQHMIRTVPRRGFMFLPDVEQDRAGAARAAGAGPGPDNAAASRPDKPSIAVLAFENMTGDQGRGHFARGLAEDIITALSRHRSFFVSARASTFTYEGSAVDLSEVGGTLGVRYVLTGSVRLGDVRVRVTTQLVEAESGHHIWAQRYDRDLTDFFALQDEITRSVVSTVVPELTDAEHERASRKPPERLDAWELYQRGLWHAYHLTRTDLSEAEGLLRASIALDPGFTAAHSALAFVLQHQAAFGWAEPGESWPEALATARRAVRMDERDALAHAVMARAYLADGAVASALQAASRAIEQNENSSFANVTMAMALLAVDRTDDAHAHIVQALRLSPRDPMRWALEIIRGYALTALGRHAEAVTPLQTAASYENAGFWPHVHLAHLYVQMGRPDEARGAVRAALAAKPDLTISHFVRYSALTTESKAERYAESLRKAGLPE